MNSTDTPDDSTENQGAFTGAPVKSMGMFFLDNQASWPIEAMLVGDLVLWPDDGKYPSFLPIASAKHPSYDGTVVVLAGNRSIIVSLCPKAQDLLDVRRCLSAKGDKGPEQYRIAVDALVQRVMLFRGAELQDENEVHPFALLQWMQRAHPKEAAIIQKALKLFYAKPEPVVYQDASETVHMIQRDEVHEQVEALLDQLTALVSQAQIVPPVPE